MSTNCSNAQYFYNNDDIQKEYTGEPIGLELQKYGEILRNLSEDGDEFILSCMLCAEIFFDYQQFLKHTQVLHNVAQQRAGAPVYKWDDGLDSTTISSGEMLGMEMEMTAIDICAEESADQEHEFIEEKNKSNRDENGSVHSSEEIVQQDFSNDYSVEYLFEDCMELDEIEDMERVEENRKYVTDSLIRNKRLLWYFIDLYREQPCLWRADHEHIADRAKRCAAIEKISTTMHKRFGFQITSSKVIKTIRNIRASYLREYHRKASLTHDTHKPKLWYYGKLSFIENAENYVAENEEHLQKIIVKQKIICKNCQREFNTRHGLAQHHRTYSLCKPFRCQHCSKTFSSRPNLLAHLTTHEPASERRYTCEFCGLKIALQHNYLVHLRRHTKQFSHHCLICGKGTPNSTELRNHMLIHTGERPHVCEVCGQTFKYRNALTRHRMLHEPHP